MDSNKNQKSFEELLREKVEGHEFPFEAGSWAQMQNKLQAQQVQAAAQQTSLYKTILAKAGKILVAAVSGSAIIYTTLSLTGALDKWKTQDVANIKTEEKATEQLANQNEIDNNIKLNFDRSEENIGGNFSENSEHRQAEHSNITAKESQLEAKENMAENQYNGYEKNASGFVRKNNISGRNNNIDKRKNIDAKNELPVKVEEKNEGIKKQENIDDKNIAINDDAKNEVVTPLEVKKDVDSVGKLADNSGNKYPERPNDDKPKTKISFGVLAGGNFMMGLSKVFAQDNLPGNQPPAQQDNAKTMAFTPVFGIYAAMPVHKKVAVEAGIQYTSYELFDVNHNSTVITYDIYADSTITNTRIFSAKYLELPLMAKLGLTNGFSIGLGLKPGLLLGADAEQYKTEYHNKSFGITQHRDEITTKQNFRNVRFNGLQNLNVWVPVQLGFAINNRFGANATYNLGLTDVTKESVFNNRKKDMLSNVQLTASYRLF